MRRVCSGARICSGALAGWSPVAPPAAGALPQGVCPEGGAPAGVLDGVDLCSGRCPRVRPHGHTHAPEHTPRRGAARRRSPLTLPGVSWPSRLRTPTRQPPGSSCTWRVRRRGSGFGQVSVSLWGPTCPIPVWGKIRPDLHRATNSVAVFRGCVWPPVPLQDSLCLASVHHVHCCGRSVSWRSKDHAERLPLRVPVHFGIGNPAELSPRLSYSLEPPAWTSHAHATPLRFHLSQTTPDGVRGAGAEILSIWASGIWGGGEAGVSGLRVRVRQSNGRRSPRRCRSWVP